MPDTIEQLGVLTVLIAVAIIAFAVLQRRRPNDDPTDAIVLLWRRWGARGRLQLGDGAAKGQDVIAEPATPKRERPKVTPLTPPNAGSAARKRPAASAKAAKPAPVKRPAKASPKAKPKRPAAKRVAPRKTGPPRPAKRAPTSEATEDAVSVLNQGPEEPPMPELEPTEEQTPSPDVPSEGASSEDEPRRRRFLRRRRGEAKAPQTEQATPDVEPEIEAPAEPSEADEPPAAERPAPPAPAVPEHEGDHVPLSTAATAERTGEPKILLRQKFRRGLRRTRERLGSEMREAFTGGATPEAFDRLEEALVAADVGVATTAALVDELRERIGLSDKTLPRVLRDEMVKQLSESDRRLHLVRGKVSVWVIVGVNGTGKTTTIAKLGARARDLGLPVALAAADTFRAAAVEQLSEWGRRLGVEVVKQDQGADPGAVVFDALAHAKATGKRLLIVDTAGRLHTRKPLMDELQKVFRVIERDEGSVIAETLLVIDATTGQNGISQAKAFKNAVPVTGLALAKLDGSAKGGITFAVERELGVPVKAVGVGESEKDLIPFDPETFVEALVGED